MDTASRARRLPLRTRQGGFTLIELAVALAVGSILLILVLNLLDLNTRVGRVQTDLSTVQQAQRVVHNLVGNQVRMAGRGGLPVTSAVDVADNVAAALKVGGNETVEGTDVLRIRGVFGNLYSVDSKEPTAFQYNTTTNLGTLILDSQIPSGAFRQPLTDIEAAIADGVGVALILVSAQNNATFAVVELNAGGSSVGSFDVNEDGSTEAWERRAVIRFSGSPTSSLNNGLFSVLSSTPGAWPDTMTRVAVVGILQEFQYYVRDTATAADGNRPKLSRAELFPNTTTVVGNASNGRVDIADNVGDFQIARAFDRNGDFRLNENYDNPESDEWLGNDPGDGPPTAGGNGFASAADYAAANWSLNVVTHVAISSLILSERTDRRYVSPALAQFENHAYSEPATPATLDALIERRFRRRFHRTVVDMRNL